MCELPKHKILVYQDEFDFYRKVLNQKRTDRNKIYSIHKPFISCIAKGKAHKQYEFGNKIGLTTTFKTLIITAIKSFEGNPHDSKTIEPLLEQMEKNIVHTPDELVYDRGGKGQKQIKNTKILTSDYGPLKRDTACQKRVKQKNFRLNSNRTCHRAFKNRF